MAVLNSNELKEGTVFEDGGESFVVLKYQHIKKGRGQATIRVKVRNLQTNSITEKTYTNEQKVETADVEKQTCQYLYADDGQVHFMNSSDYSQFAMSKPELEWELNFLQEGQKVVVTFLGGTPVGVELPKTLDLKVTQTSSAVAGNTATGATKEAVLETGYSLQVPLFIDTGEIVKINTESGEYVSRQK